MWTKQQKMPSERENELTVPLGRGGRRDAEWIYRCEEPFIIRFLFFGETASRKYIKTFFAIVSLLQYFALGATEVCLTLTERMKSGKLSSC